MANVGDTAPQGANLRITAMSVADLAKILGKFSKIQDAQEAIRRDIDAGAPVNPDGTMSLIHYVAWMIRERSNGDY